MATTNQNTLNQLNKVLSDFASNHQEINKYHFGDYAELTSSGVVRYPAMVVTPLSPELDGNDFLWRFQVVLEDKVMDGEQNETEVLSDTVQRFQDLFSYLHQTFTKSTNYGSLAFEKRASIDLFVEHGTDGTAGGSCEIVLREGFPFNKCQIPIT